MDTNTAGTPAVSANGSARREAGDRRWPRPVRLLVTVALLPVWAAAILAAENSLNFIGSWFSPVMIVLMIATVIAVVLCTVGVAMLLLGALTLVITNYKQVHEINIFAFVLVVQSLPFIAATALAAMEGSRFNEFAYWRSVEAKVAETLPRPAPVADAPVQLPAEKHPEPVQ